MSGDSNKARAVGLLQELGLKEYEAKSFVALTRRESGTAREISDTSEVPRTRVRRHRGARVEGTRRDATHEPAGVSCRSDRGGGRDAQTRVRRPDRVASQRLERARSDRRRRAHRLDQRGVGTLRCTSDDEPDDPANRGVDRRGVLARRPRGCGHRSASPAAAVGTRPRRRGADQCRRRDREGEGSSSRRVWPRLRLAARLGRRSTAVRRRHTDPSPPARRSRGHRREFGRRLGSSRPRARRRRSRVRQRGGDYRPAPRRVGAVVSRRGVRPRRVTRATSRPPGPRRAGPVNAPRGQAPGLPASTTRFASTASR